MEPVLEPSVDQATSTALPERPPLPVNAPDAGVRAEVLRRRTFAIISHPDAGKTTLTEKFLLYAGCIEVAGAVRGRKAQRAVTSDWMELERERGISITSTALSFDYQGHVINLLDTPGHQDFSEDTYRTLTAADSAVMVIDAAKGIEAQTRKLFQVCSACKIPILTFVNKMDRPGRDPLDLLGEIEQVLGVGASPLNWPVGGGYEFRGVYDRRTKQVLAFKPVPRGATAVPTRATSVDEADLTPEVRARLRDEVHLLDEAGAPFDRDQFLRAEVTPVFFGSALTNFGVEAFLDAFLELSPPPRPRRSDIGDIPADRAPFAGFIFKIQANLDPRHRDRIAFMRVCSGRFVRGMEILHPRTGARMNMKRAHRLFAQSRETLDEAYPGDVVGLVNPGQFRLGDTLCEGQALNYEGMPHFAPECFAIVRCSETVKRKQFNKGLDQLVEEGAVEVMEDPRAATREPILAAVGQLQFDVVQFRLESEYGVKTTLDHLPHKVACWIAGDRADVDDIQLSSNTRRLLDRHGRPVVLFENDWARDYWQGKNPKVRFQTVPE